MSEEWKKMNDLAKTQYNKLAATDKSRYEKEKKEYTKVATKDKEVATKSVGKQSAVKSAKKSAKKGSDAAEKAEHTE